VQKQQRVSLKAFFTAVPEEIPEKKHTSSVNIDESSLVTAQRFQKMCYNIK